MQRAGRAQEPEVPGTRLALGALGQEPLASRQTKHVEPSQQASGLIWGQEQVQSWVCGRGADGTLSSLRKEAGGPFPPEVISVFPA